MLNDKKLEAFTILRVCTYVCKTRNWKTALSVCELLEYGRKTRNLEYRLVHLNTADRLH